MEWNRILIGEKMLRMKWNRNLIGEKLSRVSFPTFLYTSGCGDQTGEVVCQQHAKKLDILSFPGK